MLCQELIEIKPYINIFSSGAMLEERRPVGASNENKRSFLRNVNEVSLPLSEIIDAKNASKAVIPEISFFNIIERIKRADSAKTTNAGQNEMEDCKVP